MTISRHRTYTEDELYPSFDGKPMAESTLQYEWIVLIKENLERLFADDPNVFIAGDLLWYPLRVEEPPAPREAPDVMVVCGRPKGTRKSYRQYNEANIAPQVAFEILSDSNKTKQGKLEMERKFAFYERYGIEEYYIYDPEALELRGWRSQQGKFVPIAHIGTWVSPRLGIRFDWEPGRELVLYLPNGDRFLSFTELDAARQQALYREEQALQRERLAKRQAEAERQQRELAQQSEQQALQRAEAERQQRELAQQRAEQAERELEIMRQMLRDRGLL